MTLCITCNYWVATVGMQCEACAGDPTVDLQGPVWCEQHPQTIWPHGDCAGPGMWYSNGRLAVLGVAKAHEVEQLRAALVVLYDDWKYDFPNASMTFAEWLEAAGLTSPALDWVKGTVGGVPTT